jgi:hypothetical protein
MSKISFGHPDSYMGKAVSKYPQFFNQLAADLPKGMSVLDLFGGVGLLAHEMWDTLQPRAWTCLEVDVKLKDKMMEPRARFLHGNAFQTLLSDELVIIDPDRCTLNQIWKEQKWADLFNRLRGDPTVQYILMQEYGAYWCHLPNQIPLYTQLSGGDRIGRGNYPFLFAQRMKTWFDFNVLKSVQGLGSTYYLMEKT